MVGSNPDAPTPPIVEGLTTESQKHCDVNSGQNSNNNSNFQSIAEKYFNEPSHKAETVTWTSVKGLFFAYQTISANLSTDVGRAVLENILDQIRKRLQPYEIETITRVATLLDGCFGRAGFVSESNYESSQQALKEMVRQQTERDKFASISLIVSV